ncbi:MAG: YciI family protein [Rhodospirillales bacterium]|nr:YciI family protein [Rhodospirillales bacterium]
MEFVIHAIDKLDSEQTRLDHRDDHVAYIKDSRDASVILAGPLLSDDGAHSIGSILIIDAADRNGAEAFAAGDPYAKAGLFERTAITHWIKTMG